MDGYRSKSTGIWTTMKYVPRKVFQYFRIKFSAAVHSKSMQEHYVPLNISKIDITAITQSLKAHLNGKSSVYSGWTAEEKQMIKRIRKQTETANRNNITRTQAYYDLYKQYPELHWAFLAHMVSRNGGWSMTDLKGDLIPRLIRPQQTEFLFLFLERANSLIFNDAYPQLLLYAESQKQRRSMFHLLQAFHVSIWMKVIWEYVWKHPDSTLLTTALIVNEQNYIEHRVVQDSTFKKYVLDEIYFKTQALLQLNQVVFPVQDRLMGIILEDFTDLEERIEFGKKLYSLLFGFPEILKGASNFTDNTKHSGSRADYWPHIYEKKRKHLPPTTYSEKLKGCKLTDEAEPFYSPDLIYVWKDRPVEPPQTEDWCKDLSPLNYLKSIKPPNTFEMTEEHCFGLNKIELAVLAKDKHLRDPK